MIYYLGKILCLQHGNCQQTRNTTQNHSKLILFIIEYSFSITYIIYSSTSKRNMKFSFAFHTLSLVAMIYSVDCYVIEPLFITHLINIYNIGSHINPSKHITKSSIYASNFASTWVLKFEQESFSGFGGNLVC